MRGSQFLMMLMALSYAMPLSTRLEHYAEEAYDQVAKKRGAKLPLQWRGLDT